MTFLGNRNINDTIRFVVNTHNPSTGAAVDADAVPSYRVYEENSSTPILTGNMELFDGSNTIGFYHQSFNANIANGFENNKSYKIFVSATVSGIVGTTSHYFKVGNKEMIEVTDNATSFLVTLGSTISGVISDTYAIGGNSCNFEDSAGMLSGFFTFENNYDIPLTLTVRAANAGSQIQYIKLTSGVSTVNVISIPAGSSMTTYTYSVEDSQSTTVVQFGNSVSDTSTSLTIDYIGITYLKRYNRFMHKNQYEPAQGAPPVSTSIAEKIGYLYKAWRNKITQTSSTYSLFNSNTTTVDHKRTVTDDGTTFTRGKIISGP